LLLEKLLYLKSVLWEPGFEEHRQHEKRATTSNARLYSPRATLCAIGIKLRSLKFFDTIAEHLRIRQKTIHHTPMEKLTDAFSAILAGAHGLCEINTGVRSDRALQGAFGRKSCAEQSGVQETLDRATAENVRHRDRSNPVKALHICRRRSLAWLTL
jgi:hypothetical protein